MKNSWYQDFMSTWTGSIKIYIIISFTNQQFFVKLSNNKLDMSSETTRYWQRNVTKKSPLLPPCLSVCLSICHSSTTERISHWSVLLQVYVIFLIFGTKIDNIMSNIEYHATRNNTRLWFDRVVKSGREMGLGFNQQPLKRQTMKKDNINVCLGKYEKGRWAEFAQDRFQ
jgi:hypothetical protein